MKTLMISIIVLFNLLTVNAQRNIQNIEHWKFKESDNALANKPDFDDSKWQTVSIPHDWAFQAGISRNGAQTDKGGYFGGGIGWYRTNIDVPESWTGKLVFVEFDGVYMNSEVWINGHYLGKRPYGYISFRYDITLHLKAGENMLAVRVDNSLEPSARWYHPCGIYAPVRLIATEKTRIKPNGIFVSTPVINEKQAKVSIVTLVKTENSSYRNLKLQTSILDSNGKMVAQSIQSLDSENPSKIETSLTVDMPNLWSPEHPYLYKVVSKITHKKNVVDEVETSLGIRSIKWDAETGFWLNGKNIKLLGVCEHWEGGPVGGAWTMPLLRWKLKLLKEMGVNAIRTAHNPCPPMFYALCDEIGLLVMDEIFDGWIKKAPEDYGKQSFNEWWQRDMEEWITRNRNHPSVIVYSLGNETRGKVAKDLVAFCHSLDSTRLVTSGHSGSEFMDIFGVNGHSERMKFFNEYKPEKPFVATEAPHTWQTRGYYRSKTWFRDGYPNKGQDPFPLPDLTEKEIFTYEWAPKSEWANHKQHFNSSYDNATARISARKNWELMRDLPWYSGHFRWTGFDYYGEAGYVHGGWPFRLFMGGALDVAGFKKDLFYFYQSQWTKEPMVHILPHWTHPMMAQGTKVPVWVYSNAEEVELFLNGASLGKDKPGKKWDEMQCEWLVPYQAGKLVAKAYKNGKVVAITEQQTAGTPSALKLSVDDKYVSPDKDRTAIVTASITDKIGTMNPYGENQIFYHINGNARIISLENGDPVDTTKNYGLLNRKAFMGLTNAFIELDNSDAPVSLVVGGILGEKQLINSQNITIDVKEIALRGKMTPREYEIYYTTDGSVPTKNCLQYSGAFAVTNGTTVKAVVFSKGEETILLNMQETFCKSCGLHWLSQQEMDESVLQGTKAVDAKYENCNVVTVNGQLCLKFNNTQGNIRWYQENDGSKGIYNLKFYFQDSALVENCNLELYVNGEKVNKFSLKEPLIETNGWKVATVKCRLQSGANEISLMNRGGCSRCVYMLEINNE
jgi:beta-galactosidase